MRLLFACQIGACGGGGLTEPRAHAPPLRSGVLSERTLLIFLLGFFQEKANNEVLITNRHAGKVGFPNDTMPVRAGVFMKCFPRAAYLVTLAILSESYLGK